jgi:hypothetical protein
MKRLALMGIAALLLAPACAFTADPPANFPKDAKEALAKYDFSTPTAALKSVWTMEANFDIYAMIAYERVTRGKKALEKLKTLEITREVEHDGRKFLFVKYKDFNDFEGKEIDRNEVIAMAKDADSGLWVRRYTGSFEVRKSNATLADEMDKWNGNASAKTFADPPPKSSPPPAKAPPPAVEKQ